MHKLLAVLVKQSPTARKTEAEPMGWQAGAGPPLSGPTVRFSHGIWRSGRWRTKETLPKFGRKIANKGRQTCDALMALMHAWQDTPLNWNDGSDPCIDNWVGIACANSRVTSIILSSMGLSGGLPGDIGQLTELQILNLSYNKLTGSLTTAIGNLKKLTTLVLVGCGFNGPIPNSIGNLERLRYLSLNTNNFTGSIPPTIGNLKSLYWLDLSQNNLTGSLPVSNGTTPGLDMLINTKHFHFGNNQLDGDIQFRLFNSRMTLIHLLFENNRLKGPIPSTLGLVKSLEIVRLDRNALSGDVPSNFNNLTNATELYLSNNQLTGPVPNLTGMNSLNYVDLSNNDFEQTKIPSWLTTLQSLTTLKMRYTNLAGELPAALFSLLHLQNVDLSYNRIDGSLNISSNPSPPLELVDLRSNLIADFKQQRDYSHTIGLILVDNPICTESGVTDRFCSRPANIITTPYSTPWNNCVPPSCSPDLTPSPNCQCAYPFTGLISFKAPSFSSLTNATIYNSLHDLLMTFFRDAGLPVDSVSLKNPSRNFIDYLVLRLEVFPSGEPNFNRTGIIGVAFALSNQTFKPLKTGFNTYTFMAENYNFLPGLSGPGGAKHKSSKTGIIIGHAAGGCVLVVLLILAGIYRSMPN
ncbi:serine/threonine/dual specificity protein kinase, catalytic domain-containing protein [Artemisia annua]|uniref:Serine/threonine/dual specificity protein kinase, catalytic domain-containing protein n=1 Tax=Artemisia annua TaxID=35608 RepID=A0A2U1LT51_ARTAN|nr:serine/threonine/dual specificity protein kinase, catalytic domain-containing protein [Artemisia annua]